MDGEFDFRKYRKIYKCLFCGKILRTKKDMIKHIMEHLNDSVNKEKLDYDVFMDESDTSKITWELECKIKEQLKSILKENYIESDIYVTIRGDHIRIFTKCSYYDYKQLINSNIITSYMKENYNSLLIGMEGNYRNDRRMNYIKERENIEWIYFFSISNEIIEIYDKMINEVIQKINENRR